MLHYLAFTFITFAYRITSLSGPGVHVLLLHFLLISFIFCYYHRKGLLH